MLQRRAIQAVKRLALWFTPLLMHIDSARVKRLDKARKVSRFPWGITTVWLSAKLLVRFLIPKLSLLAAPGKAAGSSYKSPK